MILKFLLVVVCLATVAVSSSVNPVSARVQRYAANKSHDLTAGSRIRGDYLIHRQYIIKSPAPSQIISVEKSFNATRNERITFIQAMDQTYNGTGAFPSIIRGGPGTSNVTLKFRSQIGKGINFLVMIYAKSLKL